MSDYKTYEAVPDWTAAEWKDGEPVPAVLPKWSGTLPPPAIGTDIIIKMNQIGKAKVVGYFTEGGWLGILTSAYNPPEWFIKQNGKDCIGHAFGTEIKAVEKYLVTWGPGYVIPGSKEVGLEYLNDCNGYDENDIAAIKALQVGEVWTENSPAGGSTVARIS